MKRNNRRGSMLIIVLWIIAILALLGISLGYRVTLQIKSTETSIGRISASYAAHASLAQAITVLKKDKTLDVDTLNDIWASNPGDFKDVSVGENKFSVFAEENGGKRYGLTDEESKVNLNTAPQEVLERLFEQLDLSKDLVASLMDWIDKDDDDQNHGQGAEKEYYEYLNPPYRCKNGPLENLDELLMIKGFTPEIVGKLQGKATVYGSGQINLNTAAADTFKALGFDESFIAKVEKFRVGKDDLPGTDDDGVALSVPGFITELEKIESLNGKEKILLNKFSNYFTVSSSAFQLRGVAVSARGVQKEFTAILSIEKGKDVEVVFWHEN